MLKQMKWFFLLLPASCLAGEFSLVFGTLSHHVGEQPAPELIGDTPESALQYIQPEWNEKNDTIGIEYTLEDEGWRTILTVASYEDSNLRDSWYAGIGWMRPLANFGELQIEGGAYLLHFEHEGYRVEFEPEEGLELAYIMPDDSYTAPVPGLTLTYKYVGANVSLIPPVRGDMPWTSAIQFKLVF